VRSAVTPISSTPAQRTATATTAARARRSGDNPHRYIFTLFALAGPKVEVAGGIPKTGTAGLYGFVLNKGLGTNLIATASFTATYGR
jgi:phosphatidylethanolamine-binding protein (PEBP) family uncharacterized protein